MKLLINISMGLFFVATSIAMWIGIVVSCGIIIEHALVKEASLICALIICIYLISLSREVKEHEYNQIGDIFDDEK